MMNLPIGTKWVSKKGYTWIKRSPTTWECIRAGSYWVIGTTRELVGQAEIDQFLPLDGAKFVRPFDEYLKELTK